MALPSTPLVPLTPEKNHPGQKQTLGWAVALDVAVSFDILDPTFSEKDLLQKWMKFITW